MKIEHINEPRLVFADGEHICPRRGIATYGVYDKHVSSKRDQINVGGIGTPSCLENLDNWLERCASPIDAPPQVQSAKLVCAFLRDEY